MIVSQITSYEKHSQGLFTYILVTPNKMATFQTSVHNPYAILCFKLQSKDINTAVSHTACKWQSTSLTTAIGLKASVNDRHSFFFKDM